MSDANRLPGDRGRADLPGEQSPMNPRRAEEHPGGDQLNRCGQAARPVPAADAVAGEELPPARPWQREHVLDVRDGGGNRADDHRVDGPPGRRQEREPGEAAQGLEPP